MALSLIQSKTVGTSCSIVAIEQRSLLTANYDLSREKLMCMYIGEWLNDEVINLYMILLQVRHLLIKT